MEYNKKNIKVKKINKKLILFIGEVIVH